MEFRSTRAERKAAGSGEGTDSVHPHFDVKAEQEDGRRGADDESAAGEEHRRGTGLGRASIQEELDSGWDCVDAEPGKQGRRSDHAAPGLADSRCERKRVLATPDCLLVRIPLEMEMQVGQRGVTERETHPSE